MSKPVEAMDISDVRVLTAMEALQMAICLKSEVIAREVDFEVVAVRADWLGAIVAKRLREAGCSEEEINQFIDKMIAVNGLTDDEEKS